MERSLCRIQRSSDFSLRGKARCRARSPTFIAGIDYEGQIKTDKRVVCEHFGVEFDPHAPVDAFNHWGKQRRLQQSYATDHRLAQDP